MDRLDLLTDELQRIHSLIQFYEQLMDGSEVDDKEFDRLSKKIDKLFEQMTKIQQVLIDARDRKEE